MKIDIPDSVFPKIKDSDEKLKRVKQEIAILLFGQHLLFKEDEQKEFNLEKAIQFAEDEYKFKRLLVIRNIHTSINELKKSKRIFTTETYDDPDNRSIDFGPIEWENAVGKCCLYFKFDYTEDPIRITLRIGTLIHNQHIPHIRQRLFEVANKPEYSILNPIRKKLTESRMIIYNEKLLTINYQDDTIENLMEKVQDFWQNFINNDFVIIEQIISREMNWNNN